MVNKVKPISTIGVLASFFSLSVNSAAAQEIDEEISTSAPAWIYQTAESIELAGIIRVGSEKCQTPPFEGQCILFQTPITIEELEAARMDLEELDAQNPFIDLAEELRRTGFLPALVWLD